MIFLIKTFKIEIRKVLYTIARSQLKQEYFYNEDNYLIYTKPNH